MPPWHELAGPPKQDVGLGDWQASVTGRMAGTAFCCQPCQPATRSEAGPHAGARLTAILSEAATTLSSDAMQLALRRRVRIALTHRLGTLRPSARLRRAGGPLR